MSRFKTGTKVFVLFCFIQLSLQERNDVAECSSMDNRVKNKCFQDSESSISGKVLRVLIYHVNFRFFKFNMMNVLFFKLPHVSIVSSIDDYF